MATTVSATGQPRSGTITVRIVDGTRPIAKASCSLYRYKTSDDTLQTGLKNPDLKKAAYLDTRQTGNSGEPADFGERPVANYVIVCNHLDGKAYALVNLQATEAHDEVIDLALHAEVITTIHREDGTKLPGAHGRPGDYVQLQFTSGRTGISFVFPSDVEPDPDA